MSVPGGDKTNLILNLLIPRQRPQPSLPSILPPTPPPNKQEINQTENLTNNNRNLSGDVIRSAECLRTNDITHTVSYQEESGEGRFLGVTGYVCGDEGEEGDEGGGCCVGHVETH